MNQLRNFANSFLTIGRAAIRRNAFDLLFKSIFDDTGTSCGIVYCSPNRNYQDAENIEEFYDEMFSLSSASRATSTPVRNRIILISSSLGPGGSERQIANTLVGLRQTGLDVRYLGLWLDAAPDNKFYLDHVIKHGISAYQLERRESVSRKGLLILPNEIGDLLEHMSEYALDVILNLVEEFRAQRPEVVHAWLDETNIHCGIAAIIAGVPRIVLSCRSVAPINFPFYRNFMKPAYRALFKVSNVTVLNNSDAGARSYADWLGIDRSNIRVIRNGLDLEGLRPSDDTDVANFGREIGVPDDSLVIGSIFRLGPEKRPTLWLDTARWLLDRKPDCHFVILGDGPLRDSMRAYATEIGIAHRLHMPGVRDDVGVALSRMDAFLLTSENEGLPNVVIEAQSMGVPVAAPRVGGLAEAVDEGGSALLTDDASPASLGTLLLKILDEPAFRNITRKKGPAFVARQFGLNRMLVDAVYSEPVSAIRIG